MSQLAGPAGAFLLLKVTAILLNTAIALATQVNWYIKAREESSAPSCNLNIHGSTSI